MQNPTDRFLLLAYRDGNTSALAALVKRYHKVFCEKAFWVTKDKELAKDVAQESWVVIIDKVHTLENLDRFRSWALRIIYTRAIDALKLKSKQRKEAASLQVDDPNAMAKGDDQRLIQDALLKAIRKLPKDKQDILRLFYTEEYSIVEISGFLKIPVGTVKSRLFKAREKLKSILKNVHHEK